MTGRYFVVVDRDDGIVTFTSRADAAEYAGTWDRDCPGNRTARQESSQRPPPGAQEGWWVMGDEFNVIEQAAFDAVLSEHDAAEVRRLLERITTLIGDLTAARQALTDAERERDEARAEVARLKNVIAPEKSATRTCVVCGTPLSESGPYSQRYCGRSCLEEDG